MLQIGKTYLTIWGDHQKIGGPTRRGDGNEGYYSIQGNHYDIETGASIGGGHPIVDDLAMPVDEAIKYWTNRIKEIRLANPPEKRRLVAENLEAMKRRIQLLEKGRA